MDSYPPAPQKKGIGVLGWLGIGCGGIVILAIIGVVVFTAVFGPKLKQFAEDAAKNPARATATTMVSMSRGQFEMVAEDDANKRYTVREKKNGTLTTIYFNVKTQKPEVVNGDFSAIPKDSTAPSLATPAPAPAN